VALLLELFCQGASRKLELLKMGESESVEIGHLIQTGTVSKCILSIRINAAIPAFRWC
jgi:hypothetical protein